MFKYFILQEFAISKNIQLGDEKGLKFPSVWDWSLQFTAKDCTLFHNPFYIGKSTPCVQNGSVKSFKRTKLSYRNALTIKTLYLLTHNQKHLFQNRVLKVQSLPMTALPVQVWRGHSLSHSDDPARLFVLLSEAHTALVVISRVSSCSPAPRALLLKPVHSACSRISRSSFFLTRNLRNSHFSKL